MPARLLATGGGLIGLEMATGYDALGAEVTVVELQDQLIPGCDPGLVKPLAKRIEQRYAAVHLKTSVTAVEASDDGLKVTFDGGPEPATFDRILVAVGRKDQNYQANLDWARHLEAVGLRAELAVAGDAPHSAQKVYEHLGDAPMLFHARSFGLVDGARQGPPPERR